MIFFLSWKHEESFFLLHSKKKILRSISVKSDSNHAEDCQLLPSEATTLVLEFHVK
jgi:hypothetical protein